MHFDISIDTLELNSFSPVDVERLGAALETELTRLIAQRGLSAAQSNGEIAIDPVRISAHAGADAIGVQIAQAIYQGSVIGD